MVHLQGAILAAAGQKKARTALKTTVKTAAPQKQSNLQAALRRPQLAVPLAKAPPAKMLTRAIANHHLLKGAVKTVVKTAIKTAVKMAAKTAVKIPLLEPNATQTLAGQILEAQT